MNRAVTRLIGTVVVAVLSVGISMGGITRADSQKAAVPHGASGDNGIQALLDFIYHCRGCEGDRDGGGGSGFAAPGGGLYQALVMELSSAGVSARNVWLATRADTAAQVTANSGPGGGPPAQGWSHAQPAQAIAYLGGISDSFAYSAAEAFRGRGHGNHGRGVGPRGFGHNSDTLAAVPEPAPIFLLGTILLATFSIARLRFNR